MEYIQVNRGRTDYLLIVGTGPNFRMPTLGSIPWTLLLLYRVCICRR
jgi:hypothetical protein